MPSRYNLRHRAAETADRWWSDGIIRPWWVPWCRWWFANSLQLGNDKYRMDFLLCMYKGVTDSFQMALSMSDVTLSDDVMCCTCECVYVFGRWQEISKAFSFLDLKVQYIIFIVASFYMFTIDLVHKMSHHTLQEAMVTCCHDNKGQLPYWDLITTCMKYVLYVFSVFVFTDWLRLTTYDIGLC